MIANIWNFITTQFAFSQAGMSQSAWFLAVTGPILTWRLTNAHYRDKWEKYYRKKYEKK